MTVIFAPQVGESGITRPISLPQKTHVFIKKNLTSPSLPLVSYWAFKLWNFHHPPIPASQLLPLSPNYRSLTSSDLQRVKKNWHIKPCCISVWPMGPLNEAWIQYGGGSGGGGGGWAANVWTPKRGINLSKPKGALSVVIFMSLGLGTPRGLICSGLLPLFSSNRCAVCLPEQWGQLFLYPCLNIILRVGKEWGTF